MKAKGSLVSNLDTCQPYFRAYCLSAGLSNGDEWSSTDYMFWINGMHNAYRSIQGVRDNWLPLTTAEKPLFEKWLFEQAAPDKAGEDC